MSFLSRGGCVAALALLSLPLPARPIITGVVNAASTIPPPLPGSQLAQGSLFRISGFQLGPAEPVHTAEPAATLAGVSVIVRQRSGARKARLLSVGRDEIRALMPESVPTGAATVEVDTGGASSRPVRVTVVKRTLGLFSRIGRGYGPVSHTPVRRGEQVTLRGTGLGPEPRADLVEVFVGGRSARVIRAAGESKHPGRDAIEFEVPDDAPRGCAVPVQARLLGRIPSNTVVLAVEPAEEHCGVLTSAAGAMASGGAIGYVLLTRVASSFLGERKGRDRFSSDHISAGFQARPQLSGALGPLLYLPPPGSCAAYTTRLDSNNPFAAEGLSSSRPLDVGSRITLRGETGERILEPQGGTGEIFADRIGGFVPGSAEPQPPFLNPGPFTASSSGGSDIGPFSVKADLPEPVHCTNCDKLSVIHRDRPLKVAWEGGSDASPVAVAGASVDSRTDAVAMFFCSAPPAARQMTVPAYVLESLPPESAGTFSAIMVGTGLTHTPTTFEAEGLDVGIAMGLNLAMYEVKYR